MKDKMDKIEVDDGDWVVLERKDGRGSYQQYTSCCECGLVHLFVYSTLGPTALGVRAWRLRT